MPHAHARGPVPVSCASAFRRSPRVPACLWRRVSSSPDHSTFVRVRPGHLGIMGAQHSTVGSIGMRCALAPCGSPVADELNIFYSCCHLSSRVLWLGALFLASTLHGVATYTAWARLATVLALIAALERERVIVHVPSSVARLQIAMCVAHYGFPCLYRALLRALLSPGTMWARVACSIMPHWGLEGHLPCACHGHGHRSQRCKRPKWRCEQVGIMV